MNDCAEDVGEFIWQYLGETTRHGLSLLLIMSVGVVFYALHYDEPFTRSLYV